MNNRQNNIWNQNPNMGNGNIPGNQIPYQQQQFQNNQYIPPEAPRQRQKQKKRKKKHRFLKFLLFFVLVFFGYKGSSILLNNMAEKEMSQFVVDYPFIFEEETDCLWYITHNFSVPSTYELEGKTYDVEWNTNNTMINVDESGYATVTRPDNYSIVVQLTETYKKLWGKATREYELTLIPTSSISVEDVNVISLDAIRDGSYHKDMQAVFDEEENLKYMLGEFKDTYVNSSEDAQVILQAYKNQFTQEEIEFEFDSVVNIGMYITYKFDIYRNNIRYENESASIVVREKDNKLTKISIDTIPENSISQAENDCLTVSEAIEKMHSQLDSIGIDTSTEDNYITYNMNKVAEDGIVIYKAEVLTMDGSSYEIKLDSKTGELLSYKSLISNSDEESINAISKTEYEQDISFDATLVKPGWLGFLKDEEYILKDQNRNIHAYYNEGWWKLFLEAQKAANKKDPNIIEAVGDFFVMLGGMADYYIEVALKAEIKSESSYFEDGISAQAYYNMQKVYDWYKDNRGIISYDGKGKEIVIRTNVNMATDNAAWDRGTKTFMINPSETLKYSVGGYLEVMGHEYTHAVFQYSGINLSGGEDIGGLSEAYGDIMGIIISQNNDWLVCDTQLSDGTHVVFRDLKNINGSNLYYDLKYPEVYHGENWTGEEHNICPIIGHIAYEMQANGGFSWDDLADIWYNSLGLCYDNSSTFVTCRKYIIQTADDLGYSDEQIDFIANAFDEREIFDESYEFRTDKYKNPEEQTSDSSETIKTKKESVSGDPLLDDTNNHRFLVAYSVLQMLFEGDGIYIYEEANTMTKDEQAQFEKLLNQKVEECYGIESLSGNKIKITYKQIPGWQIDWLDKICGESISYIKGRTFDILDQNESDEDTEVIKGWFNKLLRFAFDWEIKESTAYDLYDELGLIQ